MLLAIDVGNTNVVVGVFIGDELKASWRVQTERRRMPDEWGLMFLTLLEHRGIDPKEVRSVVISSVVPPLTNALVEMAETYFKDKALVVEPGIKTGVAVRYENPREVGADRIVNAVAAFHYYGGPAVVIDFGTATTFDALSVNGEYLGGAIAPGIGIAAEALFQLASRLYRVELIPPANAIGKNTTASMQSGIMYGYIGLVEGLVRRFRAELEELYNSTEIRVKVIATGGLAEIVSEGAPGIIDVVDQDLTLQGLRLIHELNG
ncbi:type III pantothenate kinase [Candidatus Chlorohelix sp.]|uniref:type III pantothenate kinase n=1 Tax=Candidatus Chlorohelix sp. TaxID=3139201 RepID=UPI00301EFEA8